ncbi:Polyisoprenoid-binding protein YceI [Fodinibius roseus]|uniref:Polyisoprenoid-binding protein YceI n=1 Tax=Fodinibius roseus TaxID=1194090 RepID=A0A1M5J715_9BACT|nr:YceI family protein [Fodinibius roseus]SHG36406.1 Polyisoprenoid-binding protein YceI [Fodinibius roseus]
MKTIINSIWISLGLLLITGQGWAQTTEYTIDKSSTMVINGTSNIKDWKAEVEEMNAKISLTPSLLEQDSMASPVSQFSLTIPVKEIESGKGGMNRKIYGALKEEDHPEIMFNLISAALADTVQSAELFTLKVEGNLSVAGTVNEVSFPVKGTRVGEDNYRFEGTYGINMKDYDVDPPSAIFGTIKSREEVEIKFNILLTAN